MRRSARQGVTCWLRSELHVSVCLRTEIYGDDVGASVAGGVAIMDNSSRTAWLRRGK